MIVNQVTSKLSINLLLIIMVLGCIFTCACSTRSIYTQNAYKLLVFNSNQIPFIMINTYNALHSVDNDTTINDEVTFMLISV